MSAGYSAVQWSRHKRLYDAIAAGAVAAYICAFFVVSRLLWASPEGISDEVLLLRATGSAAYLLLHVILCIGPAARLDARLLPILFNRRHLGVMTFLLALVHGVIAIGYYHGFGVVNPIVSLLGGHTGFTSLRTFPFQLLGVAALLILFLMAATSHDFWLKTLTPAAWKRLHMLVYPAYGLLAGHVALGALQTDRGHSAPALVGAGMLLVIGLHVAAGVREVRRDRSPAAPAGEADGGSWIDAGEPESIPLDRARTVCAPGGERIAVFRHAAGISAVTNLCAHQGGPLGEGRIIDGCISCPWHGWQYRPGDGCSPPPFQEKIATYRVRITAGRVLVDTRPLPPGSATPPAVAELHICPTENAHDRTPPRH